MHCIDGSGSRLPWFAVVTLIWTKSNFARILISEKLDADNDCPTNLYARASGDSHPAYKKFFPRFFSYKFTTYLV